MGEMKTLDEMIAVMEASKTKMIEVRALRNNLRNEWSPLLLSCLISEYLWNWEMYDYRVKPEPKEPAKIIMERMPDGSFSQFTGFISSDKWTEFIELTPEVKEKLGII